MLYVQKIKKSRPGCSEEKTTNTESEMSGSPLGAGCHGNWFPFPDIALLAKKAHRSTLSHP